MYNIKNNNPLCTKPTASVSSTTKNSMNNKWFNILCCDPYYIESYLLWLSCSLCAHSERLSEPAGQCGEHEREAECKV